MSRPTSPHPGLALVTPDELDRFHNIAAGHLAEAARELIAARRTLALLGLDHDLVEWLVEDAVALSDLAEDLRHPSGRHDELVVELAPPA